LGWLNIEKRTLSKKWTKKIPPKIGETSSGASGVIRMMKSMRSDYIICLPTKFHHVGCQLFPDDVGGSMGCNIWIAETELVEDMELTRKESMADEESDAYLEGAS
jgi:hypothetical protein